MNRTGAEKSEPTVISSELLRKVRLLELRTRLQVHDVFGGEYHSIFKGQGMDFDEVREYSLGDDIRHLDWSVSARMNRPYVKMYREERELTVLLLVDLSASGNFGTVQSLKREIAAELTALFALCALTNNDKVGLLLFTDRIEHFVAPNKGRKHVLRIIRDVLAFQPQSTRTSLATGLQYALNILRRKSVLFVISDFNDVLEDDEGYGKFLKIAGRKHDLIAVELYDPRERRIPPVGLVPLQDPETGVISWVDTSSSSFRRKFERSVMQGVNGRKAYFRKYNLDRIELPIDQPYDRELIKFFHTRERRR